MPMGVVSNEDFDSQVNKIVDPPPVKDRLIKPEGSIIDSTPRGRGKDNVEVPNSIRKLIGQTAVESGREEALDLANQLGISSSSVSAYTHGATSTSSYDDRPNQSIITKSKEKISKRARIKLMAALSHLTDEKLSASKGRELAGIAKDMSTVVKQMDEVANEATKNNNGPTFVFYSPQMRKEEVFDVVVAKE